MYIYVPNIRENTYIKQILADMKGEIDSKTIIAEDFNTLLLAMVRLSREKISLKKNWT